MIAANLSLGQLVTPEVLNKFNTEPPIYIWGASAALTLYNREILEKIGKFDNDFFAYEEDIDLALRLHNLKYQTLYIPNAISYHLGGATSKKMGNFKNKMDAKNWFYIIIKNYSKAEIKNNLVPIIKQRLQNLSGLIKNTGSKQIFSTIIETYSPVFKSYSSMIQKRKQINFLKSN